MNCSKNALSLADVDVYQTSLYLVKEHNILLRLVWHSECQQNLPPFLSPALRVYINSFFLNHNNKGRAV